MFEDYLSTKYLDLSEKELSAKRADEYHTWVKDYVCFSNNISGIIVSIIIYIDILYICRLVTGVIHISFLCGSKISRVDL